VSGIIELLAASGDRTPCSVPARKADGVPAVYLHSGKLVIAAQPTQITTILGSCVAVCVWDPVTRVGGMNHFMLSIDAGAQTATPRYAKYATATLLVDVTLEGANLARLEAKIFGGACMMAAFRGTGQDLGTQNVEAARRILASAGVPIVAEDVGGEHGRKLIFNTGNGVALVKKVLVSPALR